MKYKPKIAVVGGDLRQYAAAKELSTRDISVYAYGLCTKGYDDERIVECSDISDALDSACAIVLPLPASLEGNVLNCPALKNTERISLDRIVDSMPSDAVLFGGRIPESITVRAQGKGITVNDYFLSERLQIKNAYITAEAAVSIAMNSLDKCIKGAQMAITGTGRIARLLAELLLNLGAYVTVAARNADMLVYFELMGCKTVKMEGRWSDGFTHGYDIIFNTVPTWLFDRRFLESVDRQTLIIELASAPGGIDICAARELSSNVRWASSLPGKYAPYSAGMLIAECIAEELFTHNGGDV